MRLLINALPLLGEESGIGNYARHIAETALTRPKEFETTFFYGYTSRKLLSPPGGQYGSWLASLRGLARKATLARRVCKKILHAANSVANFVHPSSWDCYFEPNFVLLPTLHAEKKIITVHDFSCFRYPQWHPPERVRYMEEHFWQSVENASHIITVSETIRKEAAEMFGIDPARVTAVPNGVDHALFRPASHDAQADLRRRYGLPERFILYVGALEPRKNLENLLTAHACLPEPLQTRYPLLVIGSQGWQNASILARIHRQASRVRLLGYVPKRDLPLFYSAAVFFAYPSWYEGFGLPALEAMACGRSVLTSTDPALAELCANAAIYAPAGDVDSLAGQMRRLLEDGELRSSLEQAALMRAAAFDWTVCANEHLRIFASS